MKHFIAALLMSLAGTVQAADLVLTGRLVWFDDRDHFGGFSAIEVDADGKSFLVVSDKGQTLAGVLERQGDKITGVTGGPLVPLLTRRGNGVKKRNADSEGLAMVPGGGFFVSFEGNHRIWRYANRSSVATPVGAHPDFRKLQVNSGLETLAIDAAGSVYAIPERSGAWEKPFPVYRLKNGRWDAELSVPRRGKFLPVGADFGPDGKFYLLERDFVWYRGFANRIRRFDLTETGFQNEQTLLTTAFGDYDNLEGLSVWRDTDGTIRLTTISDDNFNLLQVTEIVEFRLVRD
ncbi:MAG: esterase-like activity of phytase family protein [Paracoccaceae bacterium]